MFSVLLYLLDWRQLDVRKAHAVNYRHLCLPKYVSCAPRHFGKLSQN